MKEYLHKLVDDIFIRLEFLNYKTYIIKNFISSIFRRPKYKIGQRLNHGYGTDVIISLYYVRQDNHIFYRFKNRKDIPYSEGLLDYYNKT